MFNRTLEQTAYGHLRHRLGAGLLVPVDFAYSDVVLAIAGMSKRRHGDR